jgi:hypothetical protein
MSTVKANTFVDGAGGNTATINGITPALSSQAQAEAGTDNTTQMTPLRVRNAFNATGTAPTYACRAWVNFNGTGVVAIRASGNVSSITDNGVGDYTINFTTAMQDADYAVTGTCRVAGFSQPVVFVNGAAGALTTGVRVSTVREGPVVADADQVHISIFR